MTRLKKYKNLIYSFCSLFFTMFLLVFTIYSWYTSNKEVSARGVVGATTESEDLFISSSFIPSVGETTFTNLNSEFWSTSVNINSNNLLLPVSTNDANNFYYAVDINSNGTAHQTENTYDFIKVNTSKDYYYIEKSIYLCYVGEKDADCCLKVINIVQGTDQTSNIYKAVRVYFEEDDDTTNNKIFRSKNQSAYPAVSTTSVANADPAIDDGTQFPGNFSVHLTGAVSENETTIYTYKKVNIKIWIEGQSAEALSTYSGTGFRIKLVFATYN